MGIAVGNSYSPTWIGKHPNSSILWSLDVSNHGIRALTHSHISVAVDLATLRWTAYDYSFMNNSPIITCNPVAQGMSWLIATGITMECVT